MWYSNGKEEDRESPDDEIGLEEGGHSVDGSASDADSRQPVLSGANAPSLSPSPNEGNKKEDDEEGQECAYFGEEGIKLLQQRRPFLALRSYLKESFMYYFSKVSFRRPPSMEVLMQTNVDDECGRPTSAEI